MEHFTNYTVGNEHCTAAAANHCHHYYVWYVNPGWTTPTPLCMVCQHSTCTNYSLPKILSLAWFSLLFTIFQQVSDLVTCTGFLSTTEYSSKSLHLPIRLYQPVSYPILKLYNLLQAHQPSSTQKLLQVPYLSTDFSRHTFSYSSPVTWNSIPTFIKNCSA